MQPKPYSSGIRLWCFCSFSPSSLHWLSSLLHMPRGFAAVLFPTPSVLLYFPPFFFFSFSCSPRVSLSPSFCPLLCKQCNFSLQWENRYNRGERAGLFNKGIRAKRRDVRKEKKRKRKGRTLGAEKQVNVHTAACAPDTCTRAHMRRQ